MVFCEDKLFERDFVRLEKRRGSIIVANDRFMWMSEHSVKPDITFNFKDIKDIKMLSSSISRVKLLFTLSNGSCTKFCFTNRKGEDTIKADANAVINLIRALMSKPPDKIPQKKDPLEKMGTYKDLVLSNIMEKRDFVNKEAENVGKQEAGISGSFLSKYKRSFGELCNIQYNLTPDNIECIFKAFPTVKNQHAENVPKKISETQFWIKFFQSHYVHKDLYPSNTNEIFAKCARIDNKKFNEEIVTYAKDSIFNFKQEGLELEDEDFNKQINIRSDFDYMIKRFNQHSIMILDATTQINPNDDSSATETNVVNKMNKDNKKENNNNQLRFVNDPTDNLIHPPKKRRRIMENFYCENLNKPLMDLDISNVVENQSELNENISLKKNDKYFRDMPTVDLNTNKNLNNIEETQKQMEFLTIFNYQRQIDINQLLPPLQAITATHSLTPDLTKVVDNKSLDNILPTDIKKALQKLYFSLKVLLKTFWDCFPILNKEDEQKITRLYESLQNFKMKRLVPFKERVENKTAVSAELLTKNCNDMIEAAFEKYTKWLNNKVENDNEK